MNLLKKENWWLWLILTILTGGVSMIFLAAMLNLFEEDAWYANWKNWLIGTLAFVFPVFIMFTVLEIEMTCKVAAKLNVSGHEIYLSPYIWLLFLIIPFVGWALLITTYLYMIIRIFVMLYKGKAYK